MSQIKGRQDAEREEHRKTLKKLRRITAIVTVSVILIISLIAAVVVAVYNQKMESGAFLREKTAASSKNIDVNGAVMNLYYRDIYLTFTDHYGEALKYLGFDTNVSAKKQRISDSGSWFDYFIDAAKSNVTRSLALCEAAAEEGVSLTEAELAAIKKRAYNTDAVMYGDGINNEDIYTARCLDALAYKYQLIKESEFAPQKAEIDAYCVENPKAFRLVDYYAFSLHYGTEADAENTLTEAEIATLVQELAALDDADAFENAIEKLLRSYDADISDSDLAAKISSLKLSGRTYSEGDELSDWAFMAKVGDTFVQHNAEKAVYTVYMLATEPYYSESPTVTVRHILLADSTYGNRDDAYKIAEALFARIEAESMSPDDFSLLVLEHSEDQGSYYRGGMYSNITEGQMPESFDTWCFDPARKAGDVGIVETEFGVHVILFEAHGEEEWKADVAKHITSERFEAYLESAITEYTVIFDETVMDIIPG